MTPSQFRIPVALRGTKTLHIQAGRRYEVSADGRWTDLLISATADGYSHGYVSLFRPLLRVPQAQFFQLIGMVDGHILPLGVRVRFTASASGILVMFANDLPLMYWNNWGVMCLQIR